MRFIMLMIRQGDEQAAPEMVPPAGAVEAIGRYDASLQRAGILLARGGLHSPAAGVRVTFSGEKSSVRGGPFGRTEASVGDYWIIEVKSKEEAVEWARRCPAGDGAVIEVRQVRDASDFSPLA